MYIGRATTSSKEKDKNGTPEDQAFATDHPALWEYLTATKWEDGRPRETSTLLIFVEDGTFRACFNDRANHRIAWMEDRTFQGLIIELEASLATGNLAWRASQPKRKGA